MPARRLTASREIRAVLAARTSAHGRALVVYARCLGNDAPPRAAVVAGRKVGGAVARNRAKRRLRAALATTVLPAGTDLVVVARAAAVEREYAALRAEVAALVDRATTRANVAARAGAPA